MKAESSSPRGCAAFLPDVVPAGRIAAKHSVPGEREDQDQVHSVAKALSHSGQSCLWGNGYSAANPVFCSVPACNTADVRARGFGGPSPVKSGEVARRPKPPPGGSEVAVCDGRPPEDRFDIKSTAAPTRAGLRQPVKVQGRARVERGGNLLASIAVA